MTESENLTAAIRETLTAAEFVDALAAALCAALLRIEDNRPGPTRRI